jgi:hypothetical protein
MDAREQDCLPICLSKKPIYLIVTILKTPNLSKVLFQENEYFREENNIPVYYVQKTKFPLHFKYNETVYD